jgi:colicin import membrane protein
MKAGLTTSVVLHALVLGFGLFSLSAPKAFDVADVEALPVDIVPIESLSQTLQGDKKAPKSEKPAPVPTTKPDIVPNAQKVGDNKVDTDKAPTPDPTPKEVTTAAVPKPSPEPTKKPDEEPKPQPVKQPEPKPTPVPATESTPEPQPKQEVKPDPVAETIVADKEDAEAAKLPENAPSPESRPQPPKAETAKAPDHKDAEKPAEKAASAPKSEEKEFDADQVAALLNKEKASGGGAKRSTEVASLGGEKTTGAKLSQGELDALRSQISHCWSIPVGTEDEGLHASVRFSVDPSGKLEGMPVVDKSSGNRNFDESAIRAIQICDRQGLNLPADKAEIWADVIVNFDPTEMF